MTFSLILFLLTVFTGVLWVLDVFVWKPKRVKVMSDELQQFDRSNEDALRRGVQSVVAARSAMVTRMNERPKWLEYTAGFFPVIFFIFILRSFIFEPFRIPSGSMMPTLESGDMILVNKYNYGLRLPVLNTKIVPIGEPERGDVIVFRYPADEKIDYIKRVVGLPGDKIEYINKRLTINGKPVPVTADGKYYDEAKMQSLEEFLEKLDKTEHHLLINPRAPSSVYPLSTHTDPKACDYVPGGLVCTVPKDKYFVMGDNRDNSLDSRYWGFVPEDHIVGKPMRVLVSFDKDKSLFNGGIRWNRILKDANPDD